MQDNTKKILDRAFGKYKQNTRVPMSIIDEPISTPFEVFNKPATPPPLPMEIPLMQQMGELAPPPTTEMPPAQPESAPNALEQEQPSETPDISG